MYSGFDPNVPPKRGKAHRRRPDFLGTESGTFEGLLRFLLVLLSFILVFTAGQIYFSARYFAVQIKGPSMYDTLYGGEKEGGDYTGGDFVYADRYADAGRGDIVIINVDGYESFPSIRKGETIIKRIIAVEGDRIKCEEGVVWLDRGSGYVPLEEPYLPEETSTGDFEEHVLGKGEMFVMGDNRTNSADSRIMRTECLHLDDVIGVVPGWALKCKRLISAWERFRLNAYYAFHLA